MNRHREPREVNALCPSPSPVSKEPAGSWARVGRPLSFAISKESRNQAMGRRPRRPRIPNARSTNPFDRAGHRSTACKYSLLNEFLCRFVARGIFAFCLCALRLCCVYLELREEERREPIAPCHSRIAPSQSPSDMRASLSFPVLPPQLPSALVRPPSASTRLRLAPAHIAHST
jgi:hypothetical protein